MGERAGRPRAMLPPVKKRGLWASGLVFGALVAGPSLDCGGKLGGSEMSDGGTGSSGGSSGATASNSSGGGVTSSSGGSSSSSGGQCSPIPGCQSTVTCPTPDGCGSCSCAGGQWQCVTNHSCFDASPPGTCPAAPPTPGAPCPSGLGCGYPGSPGCGGVECTCSSGAWSCEVPPCAPPPPSCLPDGGLYGLDVPDASIGDAGATLPGCYSCLETLCGSQFAACNTDCGCSKSVDVFVQCMAAGTSTLSCGMSLGGGGNPNATALLQCAAAPLFGGMGPGCLSPCGN